MTAGLFGLGSAPCSSWPMIFSVVGEAGTVKEALDRVLLTRPHVAKSRCPAS